MRQMQTPDEPLSDSPHGGDARGKQSLHLKRGAKHLCLCKLLDVQRRLANGPQLSSEVSLYSRSTKLGRYELPVDALIHPNSSYRARNIEAALSRASQSDDANGANAAHKYFVSGQS
jgi:hypothetical protein